MGVNRSQILFIALTFCWLNVPAQIKRNSFSFEEKSYPQMLQAVADAYGLYLSYDPEIFNGAPLVSAEFSEKTVQEVLELLLEDKFHYKIIQDYVVIKKSFREKTEPVEEPATVKPEPVARDDVPAIAYDTIVHKKIVVKYDTQVVVQQRILYDTVRIERVEVVYDTVRVLPDEQRPGNRWQLVPYITPNLWARRNGVAKADYRGLGFGLMGRYQISNHLIMHAGIVYNYSVNNISFDRSSTTTRQQVDTISTFFIIDQGERVPVYVVDTTDVTVEVIETVDRQNNFQSLSFFAGAGYFLNGKNLSVGMEIGFFSSMIIQGDEVFDANQEEPTDSEDYQSPQLNVSLTIPFIIKQNDLERFELTPYFRFGLDKDFKPPLDANDRYIAGLRLGIIF